TGGHPYLTQRLCQAVADELAGGALERASASNPASEVGQAFQPAYRRTRAGWKACPTLVDRLCAELFLSHGAQDRDDNLLFVRERLLKSEADLASLLELYGRVRAGKRVTPDTANPLIEILRLSGITRVAQAHPVTSSPLHLFTSSAPRLTL